MSHVTQASKRKRRSNAVAVPDAAELSLSLASGTSVNPGGPAADMPARDTAVNREITLDEEEISDVSLAKSYGFDKESAATPRLGQRLAAGGCGGGCGCSRGCGG